MSSIIDTHPFLYEAATAGDIDPFEDYETSCHHHHNSPPLDRLLTPDESTILHVYLRNQRREPEPTYFVDKILDFVENIPYIAYIIPEFVHNILGFVYKICYFVYKIPDFVYKIPDFVDKIPDFVDKIHDFVDKILERYSRNQRRELGSTDFVDRILERCPPLLLQANKKGETPLHLAAKYGHSNVVKVLIYRAKALPDPESGVTAAKMMLRMTNGEGDTALHEAARNKRGHVVEILTKEDPDFSYSANVHGETPLYIAASVGRRPEQDKVIDEILRNCISVDYGGPHGRTALHAAITMGNHGTIRKILEKEKKLTKRTDDNGWSPLHYAAYFSRLSDISVVKVLLEYDVSAACIAEKEKKRTTLHIAAIQGRVDVMAEIVSRCPACCDLVDNRGWNALHYVVASLNSEAFKVCLRIPKLERLKTEKDDKGNTPFHLIAALTHKSHQWRLVYPRGESGIYGLNKQKLSIANIHRGDFGEIQKEIAESLEDVGSGPFGYGPFLFRKEKFETTKEALNKIRESELVVATLIAMVTFAAAFTLPGGYKSDKGTAVLAKKTAFIVFLISDAISMVLSISAVFIYIFLALLQGLPIQTTGTLLMLATSFIMNAMGTMIIAFITGIYAVLQPVLGLAVSICLIGLSFFFLLWYLMYGIVLKDVRHYIS